jgi:excisionase family DNA binding protein
MSSTTRTEKKWLLPAQAANLLNVHQETVRRYSANGLIKCKRTSGNHRRYLESDVNQLAAEQKQGRSASCKEELSSSSVNSSQLSKEDVFKFLSAFSLFLDSGMKITDSLLMAAEMSDHQQLINDINDIIESVVDGYSLTKTLYNINRFPQPVISAIGVGYQSGMLSETINKMADFYREDLQLRQ